MGCPPTTDVVGLHSVLDHSFPAGGLGCQRLLMRLWARVEPLEYIIKAVESGCGLSGMMVSGLGSPLVVTQFSSIGA